MLSVMYMIILETVRHVTVTYDLGNLADWVSAAGTFTAVLTSLYLANKQNRPHIWLDFEDSKYRYCRLTNKGFQPVELRLKLPGDQFYSYFPLPPIKDQIQNVKDSQAFQKDYMTFYFSPGDKNVVSSKGYDIVTMSKYYFVFYKIKRKWKIKQSKNFITWKIYLCWRKLYERVQKN